MKKLKILFSCALLCMSFGAKAQIVKMTIEDMVIDKGETSEMVVSLENSMNIVAWQMYLYLPEGIIPYYDEDEDDYMYQLSKRHGKRHSFGITPTTDGSYLIKCYADPVQNIKENNGELFRLSLSASGAKSTGSFLSEFKKVAVADEDAVQINAEEDGSFNIEVVDATSISTPNATETNNEVYTLQGVSLGNVSYRVLPKGIYIINGKKVLVK